MGLQTKKRDQIKKIPFKDGDALFALINNENSTIEADSSIVSNNSTVDNIIDVNSSATSNVDDTKGTILSSLVIKRVFEFLFDFELLFILDI